jgi:6-phospho-beta-glucosidase
MGSGEKITLLGGGSPFVPSLIYVMLENREVLEGSEVCLMDIDPTRLPLLTKLGEEFSRRANVRMKFTWTTDPKEALEGATFVMPGYRIGGAKHMRFDFEIPMKYGICGDETAGPGGTFMAQCTIPVTLNYCRMIEDLCPDAWVISYVNPTNFVADAVRRVTKVKFIAICDCFAGFAMRTLPVWLNMPPFERRYCVNEDIRPRAIGVNHNTWLVDLLVNGEDGYPLLRSILKKYKEDRERGVLRFFRGPDDFTMRLFETYGYVNVCAYHCHMYWEHNKAMEIRKTIPEESLLGWSKSAWDFVNEMLAGADYDPNRPEYCFHLHHARHAIGIMVSIIANEGREWGGINFPNNGAIGNLPRNAIVEGPCIVDRRGITPIVVGDLPKPLLGLTLHTLNWQELTVDAALMGDKDLLYQALLACPYVHDMEAARKIMDELLIAHAEFMPQFKK